MKLPKEIWMCENEQARWFEFEQPYDLPNDVTVTKMVPEQPEQEPVAWANPNDLQNFDMKVRTNGGPLHTVPLYTTPPQRKPLTRDEMYAAIRPLFKTDALAEAALSISFAEYRAIEKAAHGIKGEA